MIAKYSNVKYFWLPFNMSCTLVFCVGLHFVCNFRSDWQKWRKGNVCQTFEYLSGHRWERINMVVKCMVHIHITAELKVYWTLVFLINVNGNSIFWPRSFKFYTKVYVIAMYDYTCELLCHYDPYSQFASHIPLSHQSLLHLQISNQLVSLCTSYYVVKVWDLPMSSAPHGSL